MFAVVAPWAMRLCVPALLMAIPRLLLGPFAVWSMAAERRANLGRQPRPPGCVALTRIGPWVRSRSEWFARAAYNMHTHTPSHAPSPENKLRRLLRPTRQRIPTRQFVCSSASRAPAQWCAIRGSRRKRDPVDASPARYVSMFCFPPFSLGLFNKPSNIVPHGMHYLQTRQPTVSQPGG